MVSTDRKPRLNFVTPPGIARRSGTLALALLLTSIASAKDTPTTRPAAASLPVRVPMSDPHLRYSGRFDRTDPAHPKCSWSAAAVTIRFRGTAINADFQSGPNDRFQVVVDGKPTRVLATGGPHLQRVADGLSPGTHTVQLFKMTEPIFGTTTFNGLQLSEGSELLDIPAPERRIEVIGDSISAGYGNTAKSQNEHFSPDTQNAYETYGAIAARAFDADYTCVAWSGRLMWPKNTIPELYDRTLPQVDASRWAFADPAPQAVVIALGTNDFAAKIQPEKEWTEAYTAFIARLRTHYPDAIIYCASSPMMYDGKATKPRTVLAGYLQRIVQNRAAAGDTKVRFLDFATQDIARNGVGADWHPSVKTHHSMAEVFIKALEQDLGWARDVHADVK